MEQLYPDGAKQMLSMNPTIENNDTKARVSLNELLEHVKDQPAVCKELKYPTLELKDKIKASDVSGLYGALNKIPHGPDNIVIEVAKVLPFENVKFRKSEIKNGKLQPPAFSIAVDCNEPYTGLSLNTGYTIKMPTNTNARSVEGGSIKILSNTVRQNSAVIIPKVTVNSGCTVIPSIYARDSEDTGFYTVNLVLVEGHLKKVVVSLVAYGVAPIGNTFTLENPEPNVAIFKPKDMRSDRSVKNPRVKVAFDTAEIDGKSIKLSTFDGTKSPPTIFPQQRLSVKGETVLFTTRKREWLNPKLVTLSGVYNATNPKDSVLPIVVGTEMSMKNTHCVVVINSRCALFSTKGDENARYRFLNGSFHHIPDYERIVQALRSILSITESVRLMALQQQSIETTSESKQRMLVFDYNRGFVFNKEQLDKMMKMSEKELYDYKTGDKQNKPYSVTLRNQMNLLASVYFPDKFARITKSKDETNGKPKTSFEEKAENGVANDAVDEEKSDDDVVFVGETDNNVPILKVEEIKVEKIDADTTKEDTIDLTEDFEASTQQQQQGSKRKLENEEETVDEAKKSRAE